ncbi:6,7-dimethyl-8-ribityllumazine synthase [Companilactobacillus keshanensis]|uniref:6,7-dimethyl-8-ribityllumazine synthase n=1 Tax=Companilactobacillus keshanensis TaxID=2486003 RepID=A0ABW4BU01_9LACO|nr:6,7-dimethyl-8-ribityllumazine synthase [Companilactobacillus keshanensis]
MTKVIGQINGKNLKIAIVVAQFNELVTAKLTSGAVETLIRCNVLNDNITIITVPGAMEISRIAKIASESKKFDGIIALGAVVKGETSHYDYVCSESASGVASVSLNGPIPVMFGILTTDTMDQALNRAGGKIGNKGSECAMGVLEMISIEQQI